MRKAAALAFICALLASCGNTSKPDTTPVGKITTAVVSVKEAAKKSGGMTLVVPTARVMVSSGFKSYSVLGNSGVNFLVHNEIMYIESSRDGLKKYVVGNTATLESLGITTERSTSERSKMATLLEFIKNADRLKDPAVVIVPIDLATYDVKVPADFYAAARMAGYTGTVVFRVNLNDKGALSSWGFANSPSSLLAVESFQKVTIEKPKDDELETRG